MESTGRGRRGTRQGRAAKESEIIAAKPRRATRRATQDREDPVEVPQPEPMAVSEPDPVVVPDPVAEPEPVAHSSPHPATTARGQTVPTEAGAGADATFQVDDINESLEVIEAAMVTTSIPTDCSSGNKRPYEEHTDDAEPTEDVPASKIP